jgi:dihydropyrimidinase
VYAETCPQYLILTEAELNRPDFEGARYVCSPPLRAAEHRDVLWRALRSDALQAVGSDHCAFTFHGQKELGRERFTLIPNGLPSVEERLPIVYSHGVVPGHLSMNRFVELVSTNPAKLMGLYPRKGSIAPGSDADLVILDPTVEWTMSHQTQHTGVDYTPFDGLAMTGRVEHVLLRGSIIVENGEYIGSLSQGQFIPRTPYGAAYTGL